MALSDSQQEVLSQFVAMTNAEAKVAKAFLTATQWDINVAMDRFFVFQGDASKLEPVAEPGNQRYKLDAAFSPALKQKDKAINHDNDKNDQQEPQEQRPISSSIQSTKGGPGSKKHNLISSHSTKGNNNNNDDDDEDGLLEGNHTFGGNEDAEQDQHEEGDEDAIFSDDPEANWGDDVEYDSLNEDGQVYLDIPFDKKDRIKDLTPSPHPSGGEEEEDLVPDPHSTAGNDHANRPSTIKNVGHRAWICEFCHSINNLLDSMKRNYQCICCEGRYRPGQKLIESAEQDAPMPEMFTVWCCLCEAENDESWPTCVVCGSKKPSEGLFTYKTKERPKAPNPVADNSANAGGSGAAANGYNNKVGNWACNRCQARNYSNTTNCLTCNKPRWGNYRDDDNQYNNNNGKKYRRDYRTSVAHMGSQKTASTYPIFNNPKVMMNNRLVRVFGATYRNSCIPSTVRNQWNTHNDLHHGFMSIQCMHALQRELMYLKPFGNRSVTINEETGWIAMIGASTLSQFIVILEPKGTGSFAIHTIYEMPKAERIGNGYYDAEMCRIRFFGENIYLFNYAKYRVLQFYFDAEQHSLSLNSEIYDPYFSQAQVKDVLITKEELIVLFDRWLGVYKLYPRLEWYHAIAFSKSENVSVRSLEMTCHDDWEDRVPMEKEAFFRKDGDEDNKIDENEEEEEDEEDQEEEKKQEEPEKIMPVETYKPSIKSFAYINCENSIISIHPANPTFDFMNVASNVKLGSSFCCSRKYGTFWVNNEKDRIMQSPKYDANISNIVCEIDSDEFDWKNFRMMPMMNMSDMTTDGNDDNDDEKKKNTAPELKNVTSFETVLYDESYGVSGRLLVQCMVSLEQKASVPVFYQMFNRSEFEPLKQELARQDYFLMPGTNRKPFNLYVYVYEMLFGSDLIDVLVQAPDFNLVYAVPGDNDNNHDNIDVEADEKKEQQVDKEQEEARKAFHPNQLLKVQSKCLVFVEDKWLNGVVIKETQTDEFEIMVDDYNASSEISGATLKMQRFDENLKYNGVIPFDVKEVWNVGDKLLYFDENEAWHPAEVTKVWKDGKGKWIQIQVQMELSGLIVKDIDYVKQAASLRKTEDVVGHDSNHSNDDQHDAVQENVEHDGPQNGGHNIAMMNLPGEGPLAQSYVALQQPVGNIDAEKSEDVEEGVLVNMEEMDMEIEEEGGK